jgi:mono/diheme cytochrome c family protein
MNPTKTILLTLAATLSMAAGTFAQAVKLPPASDKTNITYAVDIKPIFDASCVKCHSGDKAKARLHMDTLEGVLKGTKQGKIVIAGDPEKSGLIKSTAHLTKDPEGWMPPPHNKAGIKDLTPEQVGLLIGWVKQGAK